MSNDIFNKIWPYIRLLFFNQMHVIVPLVLPIHFLMNLCERTESISNILSIQVDVKRIMLQ